MNPLDIRLKNLNLEANRDTKQPYNNSGLQDVIQQAADRAGWKEKWHAPKAREVRPGVFHGIGMAAHSCVHGAGGAPSTGMVVINSDGTGLTTLSTKNNGNGLIDISADGKRVVWYTPDEGLWMANGDGKEGAAVHAAPPADSRLALLRDRACLGAGVPRPAYGELHLVDRTGACGALAPA